MLFFIKSSSETRRLRAFLLIISYTFSSPVALESIAALAVLGTVTVDEFTNLAGSLPRQAGLVALQVIATSVPSRPGTFPHESVTFAAVVAGSFSPEEIMDVAVRLGPWNRRRIWIT
jgi:hypothetical protein